jgi:hypothetical protein
MAPPIQKLLTARSIPALGPGPRPGALSIREIEEMIDQSASEVESPLQRELTRALVYLWNDHLDQAHSIAQTIENNDGSYLHAIVHRREPDYSNARYWFHRVGKHAVFAALAERVGKTIPASDDLRHRLLPKGTWDPFAFVDCCEKAARAQNNDSKLLEQIQAEEFHLLLSYFLT